MNACTVNKQGGIKYTCGLSCIGEAAYGAGIDELENDPYVWKLRESFEEAGISCTCVQKEDFIEALACF